MEKLNSLEKGLIRIISCKNKHKLMPCGLGILSSKNYIITTSQAIHIANNINSYQPNISRNFIFIDFPAIAPYHLIKTKTSFLDTNRFPNLAILKIQGTLPRDVRPIQLCNCNNYLEHGVEIFSFLNNQPLEVSFSGKIIDSDNRKLIKISNINSVEEKNIIACDGSLVWDTSLNCPIGIVANLREEGYLLTPLLIPAKIIRKVCNRNNQNIFINRLKKIIQPRIKKSKLLPRIIKIIGSLIAIVGSLIAIIQIVIFIMNNSIYPMSGDLNIAVLPFSDKKSSSCSEGNLGKIIPLEISTQLEKRLKQDETIIEIRSPNSFPFIFNKNDEMTAEKIAKNNNAQIVIYGEISCDEFDDPLVNTKIFISSENFGDALELIGDEIIGESDFGSFRIIGDTARGTDFEAQNKELRDHIKVNFLVIKALGAYLSEDPTLAIKYLNQALEPDLWLNPNGKEVIYLLLGNTYLRLAKIDFNTGNIDSIQHTLDNAENNYLMADSVSLENDKGHYARAYIGLSGVESMNAISYAYLYNDSQLINSTALDSSWNNLKIAQNSENQPISADIEAKTNYGFGQIALTHFLINSEEKYIEKAKKYYLSVIEAYRDGKNTRIKEIAALSYSALALISRESNPREAVEIYKVAYKISRTPSLKARILVSIGDIFYVNLKDNLSAIYYYEKAMEREKDLQKAIPTSRISEIKEIIKTQ